MLLSGCAFVPLLGRQPTATVTSAVTVTSAAPSPTGPTSCPSARPSARRTSADLVATLLAAGGSGPAIAKKLQSLPVHPQAAKDLLRAWLFVDPDAERQLGAFDAALMSTCGFALVDDLVALQSSVPTFAQNAVRHPDELFGVCPGADSLGWVSTTQVHRCGTESLLVVDFAARTLRQLALPQNTTLTKPGDAKPYASLAGDKIVWTNVIEHPAGGLNQPTFDGTVTTVDLDLANPRTVTAFAGVASDKSPEFLVLSASPQFVLVGPRQNHFYLNSGVAPSIIFKLPGLTQVTELPAWDGNSDREGPLTTMQPLFPNESTESPESMLYLDIPTGRIIRGLSFTDASAGCRQVGLGRVQTADFLPPRAYIIANAQGTRGGRTDGEPLDSNAVTANARGAVFREEGLTLQDWQGRQVWNIGWEVAELKEAVGNWLVMENKSGKRVVVDSRTGKEATGLPADLQALLTDSGKRLDDFELSADARQFLIRGDDTSGQSQYFFDYATVCPTDPPPGDSVPVGTGGVGTTEP